MMTPNEYAELLNYVNENHSWQNMYENVNEGRKIVQKIETLRMLEEFLKKHQKK